MPPGSADFVHRRRKASSDNPRLSAPQHFRKRILPPSSPTTVLRLPFSDLWLHPDARVRALASAPRPTSSDLRLPTWWLGHPAPDRAAGILPASSLSRHFASFAVRISSLQSSIINYQSSIFNLQSSIFNHQSSIINLFRIPWRAWRLGVSKSSSSILNPQSSISSLGVLGALAVKNS
jgi:hypothetical protein